MRLQVFDADFVTDDLIGAAVLDISGIFAKPNTPCRCKI